MGERQQFLRSARPTLGVCAAVLLAVPALGMPFDGDAGTTPARVPEAQHRLGIPRPASVTGEKQGASDPSGLVSSGLRTTLSLGAVLALVLGCAWTFKKLAARSNSLLSAAGPGGRSPSGLLEVLGRYPLSRATTLLLLRVDRRVLLVAQTSAGVRGAASIATLSELVAPDEVASILSKVRDADGQSLTRKFDEVMTRAERSTDAALDRAVRPEPAPPAPAARRRETVSSAGDRVELWELPSRQRSAFTPAPAHQAAMPARPAAVPAAVPDETDSAAIDVAAETLRRRLVALGSRPGSGPEARA